MKYLIASLVALVVTIPFIDKGPTAHQIAVKATIHKH